jgi:hypothetical protein
MRIIPCLQGSEAWFKIRAGIPTASDFSKLITSTGEISKTLPKYAKTLAIEKYSGKPIDTWEGNKYTARGKELEPDAKSLYAFMHDQCLEPVGFVTDDLQRYGCSPDSLVGTDGLAEIKCIKAENHLEAILYYRKHKRCQPDYIQQTQGQLLICERQWCDLIFYHPDLPMLTIRQERDQTIIDALRIHIDLVIAERDRVLFEIETV